MKISAPALKLEMKLSDVRIKDGRPVIVCRMGAYDATTELSQADVLTLLRTLARPSVLLSFIRLTLGRSTS